MRLIGMLDSPFVRRVAVSAQLMGIELVHEPVSLFRDVETFAAINPVVKAPTLVLDDGTLLMDSTLVLDVFERLVPPDRRLMPQAQDAYIRSQHIIGLALAAGDKAVQLVYEREQRPSTVRHQPWIDRLDRQLRAALTGLEAVTGDGNDWLVRSRPMQADVTTVAAWSFLQLKHPGLVAHDDYPRLAALAGRAEALEAFRACPMEEIGAS